MFYWGIFHAALGFSISGLVTKGKQYFWRLLLLFWGLSIAFAYHKVLDGYDSMRTLKHFTENGISVPSFNRYVESDPYMQGLLFACFVILSLLVIFYVIRFLYNVFAKKSNQG